MNKDFQEKIKKYYAQKELTGDQFSRLDDLRQQGKFLFYMKPTLFGATIAAVLMFFLYRPVVSFPESIFKEVVKNHKKAMPSEVLSSNYIVLNEALDKLDFKIASSDYIAKNFKTIGARYCSVQGKIAAQIHLENIKTKSIYTLYQYLPPKGDEVTEDSGVIDDVETKIWKEDGLVFVLAGPKM